MRLSIIFIAGLLLYACGNSKRHTRSADEIVEDRHRAEAFSPSMYLSVDGTLEDLRLSGTIINNAQLATYKDIIIAINFFDADRSLISSELISLPDRLAPGEQITFSKEVSIPEGYANISTSLREAVAERN